MKFLTKKPKKNSSPVFDILAIFGVERNTNTAPTVESVKYNEPETMPELKEETPEEPVFSVPVQAAEDHTTIVEAIHETIPEVVPEKIKEEMLIAEKTETPQANVVLENPPQKISIIVTEDEETLTGPTPESFYDAEGPVKNFHEQNLITEDPVRINQGIAEENTEPVVVEALPQKYSSAPDTNFIIITPSQKEEVLPNEPPQEIDHESSEKTVSRAEETTVPVKISMEEKSSEPYASKSFYVTLS